jgi:SIR2-like domain
MAPFDIGVKKALEELVARIKTGESILFLGAAVHAPPPSDSPYIYPEQQRPPLGEKLAEMLAKDCAFEQQCPGESPCDLQRVSLCFETTPGLGRKSLVDSVEAYLKGGKKPSPVLKMLAALPFKIIITTNYDQLLDDALRESGKGPFRIVYSPRLGEPTEDMTGDPTEKQPLVFKMHGDLEHRESIVITDEDYITFVQRMMEKDPAYPVPMTIRYRMNRWPTVFVGYSLRDYNLRLLFRTLRWRVDKAEVPPSFAVDRNPDPLILKVWQDERKFITFVTQDIWTFVPWLFEQVWGYPFMRP